ncbi:MAG: hypothetical protein U0795_26765 [Pirellulales bacterium]
MSQELTTLVQQAAAGTDEHLCGSELYRRLASADGNKPPFPVARSLLRSLLVVQRPRIAELPYPESVRSLVTKEFDRIERTVDQEPDTYFDIRLHRFRSDLRIASFGRIPVGPEHLEIDGLPRSLLVRGGVGQGIRFLRFWSRAGGVKPYYVLHLAHGIPPQAFLFVYSPQAQRQMFLRVAECLRLHPEIRGVLAGSWWHDPAVARVSPPLEYLSQGWVSRGAERFRYEVSEEVTRMATANSPPRQQLVAAGQYHPVAYIAVWSRASLLAWADGGAP